MKRCLIAFGVLFALAFVAGGSVVGFGLYNVSARAGHFPGVSWLLHTTYRSSVTLRAPSPGSAPDLSAEGMVALGAGHYDSACKFCHGAPGHPRSQTVRAMNPEPPPIRAAVGDWRPEELFWIVRNGVKMSGMPAWPAHARASDVWPVVAFLEQVERMDAAAYTALTAARETGCAMCHASDGRAHGNPQIPRLDILTPEYIALSLAAYRQGTRFSGIMQHAASALSDSDIERLAAHYGRARTVAAQPEPQTGEARRGRAIALGLPEGDAAPPACAACHGPWTQALPAENPVLFGQHRAYLREQLRLFRQGRRGGGARADLMHKVVPALHDDDIEALAAYYGAAEQASE